MKKNIEKVSHKASLPPGSLVYVGPSNEQPIQVFIMDYGIATFEEWVGTVVKGKELPHRGNEFRWTHLDGVHLPETIRTIGDMYGIHALTLEDILNTEHRPKLDETDEYIFLISKKPLYHKGSHISFESVCILIGSFGVLSFSESGEDPFLSVRSRIRNGAGKIRKKGHDYLIYALLDTVVDSYFVVLDQLQEEILQLEEEILLNARPDSLRHLRHIQRTVLQLRMVVRPMRDMVVALCRIEDPVINESTKKYFEDVLDHMVAISANTDHFGDMLASIIELHFSMMNTKMNQVVQLLTVFAAIFMPLTFIAGIYGMNFQYMPELDHRYGYFITLSLMLVVAVSLVFFFRRKKWL